MPPRVRPGEVRWDDAAVAAPITRLTTTGLARRYSVSSRTIERWERDPRLHLPEALHINKRKYRDVAALEVWELLTQVARRFAGSFLGRVLRRGSSHRQRLRPYAVPAEVGGGHQGASSRHPCRIARRGRAALGSLRDATHGIASRRLASQCFATRHPATQRNVNQSTVNQQKGQP